MELNLGECCIKEATSYIQRLITDENINIGFSSDEIKKILSDAKAGKPGAGQEAQSLVVKLMDTYGISVKDMDKISAAEEIYRYLWGLDVLEDLYNAPHVDEVRVLRPDQVCYIDKGKNVQTNIKLKDDFHTQKLIGRLIEHDRVSLDESNPGVESRRMDGTRITALGPPVVPNPMFFLRKHGTFDVSGDNYIKSETMDHYTFNLLSTLAKGRANILICGAGNSGKTTMLRWLFGFHHPALVTVSIETKWELFLDKWYPERQVIAFEAHPEVGWDLKRCFVAALRVSPNVIIVGEARGQGEAKELIDAGRSGHDGTMGTIHVGTVSKAVTTLAQLAMEEGRALPIEIIQQQVAEAFDIIIQMHGNSITGAKKVIHIAELLESSHGPELRDLCVWIPSKECYEVGHWVHPNELSDQLKKKLFMHGVALSELEALERSRVNAA